MSDFLRAEGYAVVTAGDCIEAHAALQRQRVDCMLLDVMMPGLPGFDLLRTDPRFAVLEKRLGLIGRIGSPP